MQSPIFEPTNLPKLDQAGMFENAFFEEPMMTMVVVGMIGVMALLVMRFRGKLSWGLTLLGVSLLIVGGVYLTSVLVTTDREVLSMQASDLVGGVAHGDESVMQQLLAEHVRVQTRFAGASGRDRVIALASSRIPSLVESHSVGEVRADLPGPRVGRTMVKVRVQGSMAPSSSWWLIQWERADIQTDEWRATHIEPVWIQGINNPGG